LRKSEKNVFFLLVIEFRKVKTKPFWGVPLENPPLQEMAKKKWKSGTRPWTRPWDSRKTGKTGFSGVARIEDFLDPGKIQENAVF